MNEIICWFRMVIEGVRAEYEQGASHRKIEVDIATLAEMLKVEEQRYSDLRNAAADLVAELDEYDMIAQCENDGSFPCYDALVTELDK